MLSILVGDVCFLPFLGSLYVEVFIDSYIEFFLPFRNRAYFLAGKLETSSVSSEELETS